MLEYEDVSKLDYDRLLAEVQRANEADVLVYRGLIQRAGVDRLREQVRARKEHPNVLLLLDSPGGDAHAAYALARCLQNRYERFFVFVHSPCKSAGTLVCIGADELVISDAGELGPLDVQVWLREELVDYGEGQDTLDAIDFLYGKTIDAFRNHLNDLKGSGPLSGRAATDIAVSLTTGLFSPIFSQIDPVRLGELSRAAKVAQEYGRRLAGENVKNGALEQLISGYPSHSFVIDRTEAEQLFHQVREPVETEENLGDFMLWALQRLYQTHVELLQPLKVWETKALPADGMDSDILERVVAEDLLPEDVDTIGINTFDGVDEEEDTAAPEDESDEEAFEKVSHSGLFDAIEPSGFDWSENDAADAVTVDFDENEREELEHIADDVMHDSMSGVFDIRAIDGENGDEPDAFDEAPADHLAASVLTADTETDMQIRPEEEEPTPEDVVEAESVDGDEAILEQAPAVDQKAFGEMDTLDRAEQMGEALKAFDGVDSPRDDDSAEMPTLDSAERIGEALGEVEAEVPPPDEDEVAAEEEAQPDAGEDMAAYDAMLEAAASGEEDGQIEAMLAQAQSEAEETERISEREADLDAMLAAAEGETTDEAEIDALLAGGGDDRPAAEGAVGDAAESVGNGDEDIDAMLQQASEESAPGGESLDDLLDSIIENNAADGAPDEEQSES